MHKPGSKPRYTEYDSDSDNNEHFPKEISSYPQQPTVCPPVPIPFPSVCFPQPNVNLTDGPQYPQPTFPQPPGVFLGDGQNYSSNYSPHSLPYPDSGLNYVNYPTPTEVYPSSGHVNPVITTDIGLHDGHGSVGISSNPSSNYSAGVVQPNNQCCGAVYTNSTVNYRAGEPRF